MDYEPGPCQLIRPDQIPRPGPFEPVFENLAAPVSGQLGQGAGAADNLGGEVASIEVPAIEQAFDQMVHPAIDEINWQLQNLGDIDLGPAIQGLQDSLIDFHGVQNEIMPGPPPQLGQFPNEGGDRFDEIDWQPIGEQPPPPEA